MFPVSSVTDVPGCTPGPRPKRPVHGGVRAISGPALASCHVLLARVDAHDDIIHACERGSGERWWEGVIIWPWSSTWRYEPERDASFWGRPLRTGRPGVQRVFHHPPDTR